MYWVWVDFAHTRAPLRQFLITHWGKFNYTLDDRLATAMYYKEIYMEGRQESGDNDSNEVNAGYIYIEKQESE